MTYFSPTNPMQDLGEQLAKAEEALIRLAGDSALWLWEQLGRAWAELMDLEQLRPPPPDSTDPAAWDAEAARQRRMAQLASNIAFWSRQLAAILRSLPLTNNGDILLRDAMAAKLDREEAAMSRYAEARRSAATDAWRRAEELRAAEDAARRAAEDAARRAAEDAARSAAEDAARRAAEDAARSRTTTPPTPSYRFVLKDMLRDPRAPGIGWYTSEGHFVPTVPQHKLYSGGDGFRAPGAPGGFNATNPTADRPFAVSGATVAAWTIAGGRLVLQGPTGAGTAPADGRFVFVAPATAGPRPTGGQLVLQGPTFPGAPPQAAPLIFPAPVSADGRFATGRFVVQAPSGTPPLASGGQIVFAAPSGPAMTGPTGGAVADVGFAPEAPTSDIAAPTSQVVEGFEREPRPI